MDMLLELEWYPDDMLDAFWYVGEFTKVEKRIFYAGQET